MSPSANRSRQAELEAKAELVGSDQTTPVVISVEHLSSTPAWAMRAALYSPRGTAATEIRAEHWTSAIEQLVSQLSQQIDQQADRRPHAAQWAEQRGAFPAILSPPRHEPRVPLRVNSAAEFAKDRATKKCRVPFARNSPFGCFAQKVPDTYLSLIAKSLYDA